MFCVKLGKKERYKNSYRMTALLGLLFLAQFMNPPTAIGTQEQPEITVTVSREGEQAEQELLVTATPIIMVTTERLTGTQETPAGAEEATESGESSAFLKILLLILIGILILGVVLILLLRWEFRRAAVQRERKRVKVKADADFPKKSDPVEWNLDLEAAIPLPATSSQLPKGVPYLESLNHSTKPVYFALTQPLSRVGRGEENELRIDESFMGWQTVSRYHAKIERDGEALILIDNGSSNGTQVNGRHSKINLLENECIINFGRVKFAFHATTLYQSKS